MSSPVIPDRLIRPLAWLQPGILLAAVVQRPAGSIAGWLSLVVRDSVDPMMPHVLATTTLHQDSDGRYRAHGIPGVNASLTPSVRALCSAASTEIAQEIARGHPLRLPPPLPPRRMEQKGQRRHGPEVHVRLSAMELPSSRKRLVASIAVELTAIAQAPSGVLPLLASCDGLLPSLEVLGWFVVAAVKLSRAGRRVEEVASV